MEILSIIKTIENKLGFLFKPLKYSIKKEHYALIRNDLAIDQNRKGIIMRIKDENGEEFLLIDDSLEQGGELETVGKGAFKNNIHLQKWWIEHKNTNFKMTPSFLMEKLEESRNNFNEIGKMIKEGSEKHFDSELRLKQMQSNLDRLTGLVFKLIDKQN